MSLKITQCEGEGHGSCTMCNANGIWNINWMCFFISCRRIFRLLLLGLCQKNTGKRRKVR